MFPSPLQAPLSMCKKLTWEHDLLAKEGLDVWVLDWSQHEASMNPARLGTGAPATAAKTSWDGGRRHHPKVMKPWREISQC